MFDSIVKLDSSVKNDDNLHMAGKKQFNEEETLDRAITVFWERGYAATSMQDLAQATGVLRGSLYNAYGDKQAIFLRVFERYRRGFLDAARAQLANSDPAVALHDFFAYTIRTMTEIVPPTPASPGPSTRGCLTTKIATDETAMDEPVRAALRSMLDELEEILLARLVMADARARLALPPADAARLAATLTRGIVVMERIYHAPAVLLATADSLVEVLFKSTRPAVPPMHS